MSVSDTPSAGTLSKHVDEEDKNTVVICDGTPGNPNQTIINESSLCSLVFFQKPQQKPKPQPENRNG